MLGAWCFGFSVISLRRSAAFAQADNLMKRNDSLRDLCVLCVSAVKIGRAHSTTAETQRTQRSRREFLRRSAMFIDLKRCKVSHSFRSAMLSFERAVSI